MSASNRVQAAVGSEWDDGMPNNTAGEQGDGVKPDTANNQVKVILQHLDDQEWQVFAMRFGLIDGDEKSIADISKTLALSSQQIRQIEYTTLDAIMHSDQIKLMLGELKDREQLVISKRFGLIDGKTETLREVSDVLHLTTAGVRRIERAAIVKLIFNALGVPLCHFEQLNKERRVAQRQVEALDMVRVAVRELARRLDRKPNIDEIAGCVDMTVDEVVGVLKYRHEQMSAEPPMAEEVDVGYLFPRCVIYAEDLQEFTSRHSLAQQVNLMLRELNKREAKVLVMRFGLQDGEARTLQQIGQELDLTRERVRQIQRNALDKLSSQFQIDDLRELLS